MLLFRPRSWVLLVAVGLLALAGCEPYMSMTDQVPAQTRRAAALLPSDPRFVGMVDLEEAFQQVDELQGLTADSLRAGAPPPLGAFLDATGLNPQTDLKAVYGTLEGSDDKTLSAVVFANLTADQMDKYLEQASEVQVERTTYRGTPLYQVPLGAVGGEEEASGDDASDVDSESSSTLHLVFVDNGTVGVALDADRARAMVDRHQGGEGRLSDDEAYMTLVQRLGRDRTAWVAGRNVLETALGDSTALGSAVASAGSSGTDEESESRGSSDDNGSSVAQAGVQRALVQWSNRVLGLNEMSSGVSALEEKAGGKIDRLKEKVREQALAVTLTDETLEGEAYLTMADDATASDVVEMAEGLLAILRLSQGQLSDQQQDLLDQAAVEREGPLVRVQFSLVRELLRQGEQDDATARRGGTVRWSDASTRPANEATHRLSGIMTPLPL